MKKFLYTLLVPVLTALALSSCESIIYDGEYDKDGVYHSRNNVRFYYADPADTLIRYSFGSRPQTLTSETIDVPVRLVGNPTKTAQRFRVSVDTSSTAKVGVHYETLKDYYEIAPDSVNGIVPITVLREHLPYDHDTVSIVLHLLPGDELGNRFSENNTVRITVNNVIGEPIYWQYYIGYFGPYERRKYLELLSYYNSSETQLFQAIQSDMTGVFLNFVKVWRKLQADPDYQYKDRLPSEAQLYNPYK